LLVYAVLTPTPSAITPLTLFFILRPPPLYTLLPYTTPSPSAVAVPSLVAYVTLTTPPLPAVRVAVITALTVPTCASCWLNAAARNWEKLWVFLLVGIIVLFSPVVVPQAGWVGVRLTCSGAWL